MVHLLKADGWLNTVNGMDHSTCICVVLGFTVCTVIMVESSRNANYEISM